MLKLQISKLDDVPEALRELYTEKDGKFELAVEGAVPKGKLDEFRTNNVALREQLDALGKKYEGIDPAVARGLIEENSKLKDKKLIDSGKIDELLSERTASMRADYDKKLADTSKELGITKAQLEKLVIDNAIQVEAVKAGIRPTAMEDILLRGRSRFKLKDGAAVATAPDDKVIYGKDGITPQSMSEWLADLAPAAPHLFESSGGGGSQQQRTNAAGEKTLKRADFDKLDPRTQAAKMTEGFKLVD